MFLRRLLYCETGVILAAFALVIPVFLEGDSPPARRTLSLFPICSRAPTHPLSLPATGDVPPVGQASAQACPASDAGFETRGPNRTEFIRSGFQIRMTPASGLLGSPFAVLALLTYYRRDLIPNTGGDFLR